jgi:hypothetical protein
MPDRKILTLKADQGQDEANYGGEKYPVNLVTHTVEVPEEAAPGLLAVGGFTLEPTPAPVTPGFVRLIDAAGDGCSWGGVTYTPDADGFVTVPIMGAADLAAHGYVSAPPAPEADVAQAPAIVAPETDAVAPEAAPEQVA